MKIVNDYRLWRDDSAFENIIDKKTEFLNTYISENRKMTVYNIINNKSNHEYTGFETIYSNRCAYCGKIMFYALEEGAEIDHFDPNKKAIENTLTKKDQLLNLIYSCKSCNQGKKYILKNNATVGELLIKMNPDTNIRNVFYRDEHFGIQIEDNYKNDELVTTFYKKLKFNNIIVKFDYMIIILDYIILHSNNQEKIKKYKLLIDEIRKAIKRIKYNNN